MSRKIISKGLRFEIFKRDRFTCQYCGKQPPEIVLVIDHIQPVSKGGNNDEMNLVTACEPCNQGKAAKKLGHIYIKPDADVEWLSMQQEIAELQRYQIIKAERDKLLLSITKNLADDYLTIVKIYYDIDRLIGDIHNMLLHHQPEHVEEALKITAHKVDRGYLEKYDHVKYVYGILNNMEKEQ